jgi:hypothetical protein
MGQSAAVLVEESALTRSLVDAALRYRAAYPDEIDARIELHRRGDVRAAHRKRCGLCWFDRRALTAGMHHPGVLIVLSSRFSRRPSGIPKIANAICDLRALDPTLRVVTI